MTRLLLVKLIRDMRSIWPRIVLMIIAMSITLAMFGAVCYTWGAARREIARAYLSTNPASATILLERGLEASRMALIASEARKRPGIIEAAARTQLTVRVQGDGGGWRSNPLQIFVAAPDDPMRIETLSIERGNWPPPPGEILIDRSSLDPLNLEDGGEVVVELPGGDPQSLRISGVVYYPGLAPSFQEQKGHGFMSSSSLPVLKRPVTLDALKIHVAGQPGSTEPSRNRNVTVAAARDLADWLRQNFGVAVREIQAPEPYAHPHQRQADLLLMALLAFAVAGLLLSAILVATMLEALFARQIPQIGIMKAIGARSSRILQFYLLMTLVIAAASTVLAIVPGILIGRAFSRAMLTLLGVDAGNIGAPWWMYGTTIATGLGLPGLFSLIPLMRASRTTVREALAYRGGNQGGYTVGRLDDWLNQLRVSNRTLMLAFRNSVRSRGRFLLSVGLLATAGAVFVAGMSTVRSVQALEKRTSELRKWDVEVELSNVNQTSPTTLATLGARIPHVTRVEAWTIKQTSLSRTGDVSVTRTYPDQGHGGISVSAIPRGSSLMSPPPLLEGRWLRTGEAGAVVISRALRTSAIPGVHTGDTLQLSIDGRPTRWRVVGIAETVGGDHGGGLWITEEGFAAATGASRPNMVRIVTDSHDEATRATVAEAAERVFADAGLGILSSVSVSRSVAAGAGHMLPVILIFLGLSVAIGVVGFVGLASAMSTNVIERTREFGVMRALGARASTVRRIVIAEGVFKALASCVLATIPTILLTAVMGNGFGRRFLNGSLPFHVSVSATSIWMATVILGAVLASLIPAFRASRLTIRVALAHL